MTLAQIARGDYMVTTVVEGSNSGKGIMTPGQANEIRKELLNRLIFVDSNVFGNTMIYGEVKYYRERASISEMATLLLRWNNYYGKQIKRVESEYYRMAMEV